MNSLIVIEEFATYPKVTYYTLRYEEDELSETDQFLLRFEQDQIRQEDEQYMEDFQDIVNLVEQMGERRGAKQFFFNRFEEKANALPPKLEQWFGNHLRLYCIRLSDQIVILGNGGVKSSQSAQDSPDLSNKFRFINRIACMLNQAILSQEIRVVGNKLEGTLELYI